MAMPLNGSSTKEPIKAQHPPTVTPLEKQIKNATPQVLVDQFTATTNQPPTLLLNGR